MTQFQIATPWRGFGKPLTPGGTIEDWKIEAGFTWTALMAPVLYEVQHEGQACDLEYEGKSVIFRDDNNFPLSIVSSRYKPMQPGEVLEFFRDLVSAYGSFQLETAGIIQGGRKIWALASAAGDAVVMPESDEEKIHRYLLLATSFDTSIPTVVQQTAIRFSCANALGMVFARGAAGDEPQIKVRHNTEFKTKAVQQKMSLDQQWTAFNAFIRKLVDYKLGADPEGVAKRYFLDVFYPEATRKLSTFSETHSQKRVSSLMEIFRNAPGQQLVTAKDTAWGLVNAVTYYIDHVSRSKSPEARLDKAWFGEGNKLKNRAASLAADLAGIE